MLAKTSAEAYGPCVFVINHRRAVTHPTPRDASREKSTFICGIGDISEGLKPTDRVDVQKRSFVAHCGSLYGCED